jgi:uncharacterized secreted protein with C-terminal beta-propeller domain
MKKTTLFLGLLLMAFTFTYSNASAESCNTAKLSKASYGQKGSVISNLQTCLIKAGYSISTGVTGVYDESTREAVKAFYKSDLYIDNWNGNSVGTLGRKALALKANGGTGPALGNITKSPYKKASSLTEFKKYLDNNSNRYYSIEDRMSVNAISMPTATQSTGGAASLKQFESSVSADSRYSETNVQVTGIDEPDIIKTDGKNLYISKQGRNSYPIMEDNVRQGLFTTPSTIPPTYNQSRTLIVNATPLSELGIASDSIKETGEFLYSKENKILIILSQPNVVAYDVSDPKNPIKKWAIKLESNTSITASRMTNGSLYLITNTWVNDSSPCSIPILSAPNKVSALCTDIWVPIAQEPVNAVYTVMAVNPNNGVTTQKLNVGGESGSTVISVFPNNIYLSYRSKMSQFNVMIDFVETQFSDLLSADTIAKIKKINGYDISNNSKMSEIEKVISAEVNLLDPDKKLKYENEFHNRMTNYTNARLRDIDRSVIVRIPLSQLSIATTASIPGHLLNQFSLDEYNGYLRLTTTVGETWGNNGKTRNDVYVLNQNLAVVGSILDLGITERIYSTRFVGDKGYLVTFRQVDPFYVLDLSNPKKPVMAGELKIPGYSSYLEPIDQNTILGVGQESGKVKVALFDVSNPKNPTEQSKYTLTDSWTDVNSNHHAFLKDDKHKVFFIPGGQGGYVFGYEGNALTLKTTVSGYSVKRAIYIGDYLYVIGDGKISVLNENTWIKEKELDIK